MQTKTLHLRSLVAFAATLVALLAISASAQAAEPEGPFAITPGTFATEISTNQAGAHPDLTTRFKLDLNGTGQEPAGGGARGISVVLPKGLIGAPTAAPACPIVKAVSLPSVPGAVCPLGSAVGVANVEVFSPPVVLHLRELVYNVIPYPGEPAAFAFLAIYPVRLDTYVRPDGDYGVTATVADLTEGASVLSSDLTLWGVPADHTGPGPEIDGNSGRSFGNPSGEPRIPFMTNPTECSGNPLESSIAIDTWQKPVQTATAEYSLGPISGCDQLEFEPTIAAQPTTSLADAPSGLDFNLHVPQHTSFVGQDEVQSLKVDSVGGHYNLTFGGQTTGDMFFFAGAGQVQSELEALPSIGVGNVLVTGGFDFGAGGAAFKIIFKGALARTDVEQLTVASSASDPLPGTATVTTTVPGVPTGSPGQELATSHLRDAVVKFPAGMTVNPSSANGLQACSLAQVGMLASGQPQGTPVACPNASKIGTVEVVSPAIGHPLPGSLYLAKQGENPFGSLLALYLVIDDPVSGVLVKLPGKVEADPTTGQLTTSFNNNPQLPVEDLSLHLFKGDRAALKTPAACGTYTTTSTLTPWSAPSIPAATPSSPFPISAGPAGGACLGTGAAAPNKPTFSAGTLNPTASAYTPFVLKLTRADGTQPLKSIDTTLPKGLLARLAGTPYCSDAALAAAAGKSGKAEQASPSCPAASEVGTVNVGAGAGSGPVYVSGKAYLAGPYKGAPLSLAVVTPAVAGPFDLGTVVVRTALSIDPVTAQVHALSDPFPTILQGIPLDIRSIGLNLDKPSFVLNPTNCDPAQILGGATSVFDQAVSFAEPFQVGDCAKLKFAPKLHVDLKGGTKRNAYPALTATLTYPKGGGYANIASAQVTLPHSAFLEQAHIGTVCTRVQFAAKACPQGSIYGKATAISPLLDQPLEGPVYLRSSNNPLPDLVADLNGQIEVTLDGKIDTGKGGGIRNTFELVPDAPVSKFVLSMRGGKKGLLVNSENICRKPQYAVANFTGQNGDISNTSPLISNDCKKTKKKKSTAKHRKDG